MKNRGQDCAEINSVGDYITVPRDTTNSLATGDFTIEMFVYKVANNANASRLWSTNGDLFDGVRLSIDASGYFGISMSTVGNSWNYGKPYIASVSNGQWYHLAVVRSGGSVFSFVNGVKYTVTTALGASTALYVHPSATRVIGGQDVGVDRGFNGYIDEVRITRGKARYTENFTPPTAEFPLASPNDVGHSKGDLASATNAAGHVTQYTKYDRAGRVRQMIDAKGVVSDISYTPRGWVSSVTSTPPGGAARTTTYSYDNAGQLTGVSHPDGTTLSYSYDAAQRLVGVSDERGNTVSYTLDNMGNRVSEEIKDPGGVLQRSISRSFDALNRLQQVTGAAQ